MIEGFVVGFQGLSLNKKVAFSRPILLSVAFGVDRRRVTVQVFNYWIFPRHLVWIELQRCSYCFPKKSSLLITASQSLVSCVASSGSLLPVLLAPDRVRRGSC